MSDVNESSELESEMRSNNNADEQEASQSLQRPGIGSKVKGLYSSLADQELVVEVLDVNQEQQ